MALTRLSIEDIELYIQQIDSVLQDLEFGIYSISSSLENDSNYQIFVQGTDIGRELNEKLQKVIALQKSLNEGAIEDIVKKCSIFIEIQKELNEGGV